MKKELILAGICFSLIATTSSAVSLRDSVEKALNTNPDIIAERKNQEAFRKYVDEREGRYLPTLDLESYFSTEKEKIDRETNQSSLNGQWVSDTGYNAALVLRQFIYDGGLTPSQVAETKYQNLANKYRSIYAIENTILETVKSYTGLVQFDERLILSADVIKTHEENLATAKEKEEISGEVLETYQVSSKLNFVTDSYIQEQELKNTGIANYIRYVGSEPEGNVCRPVMDETKVPSTLNETIEMAVLRNHRILEQIEKVKLQREKIAQSDATFLPVLNLELRASIDKDLSTSDAKTTDQYARLNFNWNLFNGNRDSNKSEQEEIFLREQKKTLDDITNQVVSEIKSVYNKHFKNKQRIEALKNYVEANVNIVEVYRSEFEAGTRTFVDILDAESELYSSSKTLINMEYTALNNYYDLMFNLSLLSDSILSSTNQNCANVEPRKINYTPEKKEMDSKSELDGLISNEDSALINKELGLDTQVAKTASSDVMKMATFEYKSFLEAPKNYYTINLTTKNGMAAASNYINQNSLGDDAFAFEFGPRMKSVKVLYGIFSNVREAKIAMKSLNKNVLSSNPYIDNISKHQALYAKYN